ncbi:ATP-binding protein [Flavobacterium sp. I-SCBP12n]|uniref:ATP-binding protein n=1 Tax=Flavobacterium pygoscelis TaxID=2893176 RepID=A0A9X1XUW2_9FLAO|nr:AAA family ATPase [Flavobacterium pygoscelis]MCK8143166.1 ATP-binding protein [Flavobacterium pygoscelis]
MTHTDKLAIVEHLDQYITQKGSQNKVAIEMKTVSAATLSQMRNHNWENIAEEMWRKVSAFLGIGTNEWKIAETGNSQLLMKLFSESQNHALVIAITGNAGSGKTAIAKKYEEENKNVYRLSCNEYWDKKWFLRELLSKMGKETDGMTLPEMMYKAVTTLKSVSKPKIILDEADKLTDTVLLFFITLYNELEGHCGITIMATQYLEKRIRRGIAMQKKGYREIYSRVGLRFIELDQTTFADIKEVCVANGLKDEQAIRGIAKDADGDLRRVKRLVFANKRAQ